MYDLDSFCRRLNAIGLRAGDMGLFDMGLFHAGVEAFGEEITYASYEDDDKKDGSGENSYVAILIVIM